jgi:hypothetical protein
LVNNTETLAMVPWILEQGFEALVEGLADLPHLLAEAIEGAATEQQAGASRRPKGQQPAAAEL